MQEYSGLFFNSVTLIVKYLDKVVDFYTNIIGLEVIYCEENKVCLGVNGRVLLILQHDQRALRRGAHEAGLFHTAFLLPSFEDLAHWVKHAIAQQVMIAGASDHKVSEALYVTDPEGNGVEIYADYPSSAWEWREGRVQMGTSRLDIPALLKRAPDHAWSGAPEGTRIGHVHLQVGDLEQAEHFYTTQLGLEVTCRYPGAIFYASGGYHHHIATNIWQSSGAGKRSDPVTGLSEIALTRTSLSSTQSREAPGERSIVLNDPWGTAIKVNVLENTLER